MNKFFSILVYIFGLFMLIAKFIIFLIGSFLYYPIMILSGIFAGLMLLAFLASFAIPLNNESPNYIPLYFFLATLVLRYIFAIFIAWCGDVDEEDKIEYQDENIDADFNHDPLLYHDDEFEKLKQHLRERNKD